MILKSVTDAEPNVKSISITVEPNEFADGINKAYLKARKKISIPGFRKGKAPKHIIERMYGKEFFYEDALDIILPDIIDEALKQADLPKTVLGPYDFKAESISEETGVEITFKQALYPEADPGQYKGLEAVKPKAEVSDDEVEHEISHLLEQNARHIDIDDRAAQSGDTVTFDYKGFVDGEAFEGGEAQDYDLVLGSGTFIPGFEDQVAGHSIDEEFDVNVTFPEDYSEPLAGKEAVFNCKIKAISVIEYPELDDEFAKDQGEYDTVEDLKNGIRAELTEHKQHHADDEFENNLRDILVQNVVVDIPAVMIDDQAETNKRSFVDRIARSGLSLDFYMKYTGMDEETLNKTIRDEAENQIKLRLALEAIAKIENFEIDDEAVENEYKRIAEAYGYKLEEVKKLASVDDVKKDLSVQKAMEFVVANAVAKEPDEKPAEEPQADDADEQEAEAAPEEETSEEAASEEAAADNE